MRVAVAPGPGRSGLICAIGSDGTPGAPAVTDDLPAAVRDYERAGAIRWIFPATAEAYPPLLRSGARVARCHDVALTEALLLGREGRPGEAASLPAASARLRGEPVPRQRPESPRVPQQALFEPPAPGTQDPRATLDALTAVHADQLARIAAAGDPRRLHMLVAAESAGGLAAAEMSLAGLPWRAELHDELLTGMLGRRPPSGTGPAPRPASAPVPRPPRLAELAAQISAALGSVRPVNPDSPAQLIRALAAQGVRVPSTRIEVLRQIDHPVIPALLEYKELSRLHAAHGWAWLETWVSGGRFRPEYVVGGVVSGRWASRGGGALQIPRILRRAVVADPGWVLVVGDAAQLEPRVLAALAGDQAFAEAAAAGDLYAVLATAFAGDRAKAKLALLSAMYGGAGGEAGQLLAVLRRRFPVAAAFVEAAARAGEEGKVVHSVLGRACPPPSAAWRAVTEESGDPDHERDPGAGRASRARGRFTRNFVVQASAADWALVLLAGLRARLAEIGSGREPASGRARPPAAGRPELVLFQHDEVIVHCPEPLAGATVTAIDAAADAAARLVFGATAVRFPMTTSVVRCYADAK